MPRVLIVCCTLAAIAPSAAHAQLLSLGLRGGASQSTMSLSSGSPASRTGIVVGPTGMVWLSDALAIQFDALYVGKGFKPNSGGGVTSALKLSYIDVPIAAVFSLPKASSSTIQVRLQAGGTFGFRVQCSVDQGTGDVTGITDCKPDNVGTFDFGIVGGAGVKIGKGRGGIVIDATYTLGLLDANLASDLSARNRAFQISAGFLFPIM